jgi:pyruvate,water dikinase
VHHRFEHEAVALSVGVQRIIEESEQQSMPKIDVKIMMNVATPDQAFAFSRLPNAGVGLARVEFIINNQIGIHPKALLEFDELDGPLRSKINEAIAAYQTPRDFFVRRVAEGVATIAAAFAPNPVIVRCRTSSPTSTPV